jgi:hypothetical protein
MAVSGQRNDRAYELRKWRQFKMGGKKGAAAKFGGGIVGKTAAIPPGAKVARGKKGG